MAQPKTALQDVYAGDKSLFVLSFDSVAGGGEYTSYQTLGEMADDTWSFQLIFRIVLALLIFIPAVLLYYVPFSLRYNNAYQEPFVRLIRQPTEEPQLIVEAEQQTEPEQNLPQTKTTREAELFERLEKYMNSKKAW